MDLNLNFEKKEYRAVGTGRNSKLHIGQKAEEVWIHARDGCKEKKRPFKKLLVDEEEAVRGQSDWETLWQPTTHS